MTFNEFKGKYQKEEVNHFSHHVHPLPLVSVMVQTFQHERFLRKCLDSILGQICNFPFEILLGEDSSKDDTRRLCIEYAAKFPEKIRLFLHHPKNKIRVLNITTGNFNALYNFFSAKGDYIAFCEGDDLWTDPFKLQKQVDLLNGDAALAFTYHSYLEVNEQEELLSKEFLLDQPARDLSQEDLMKLTMHPLLSTVCFRNCIENIPYEMAEVINVDSFLFSLLGNYGKGKYQTEVKDSLYRRHIGGIWSKQVKILKFKSKILTYKKLEKYYLRKNNPEIAEHFHKKIKKVKKMQLYYSFKNLLLSRIFNR